MELQVQRHGGETLLRLQENGTCTVMQMATQQLVLFVEGEEVDKATLSPYDAWSIIIMGESARFHIRRRHPGSIFDLVDYRDLFLDYPVVEEWYHQFIAPVQPVETIKYVEIHRMPTELSVWVYFTDHPMSVGYHSFLIGERTAPMGSI